MAKELGRNALHLAVLSAFAFAEPLFDLLGKTPEFFVVRGSHAFDIVFFALALLLVPPLVLVALEALVAVASRTAAWVVHLLFVAGLAAIVAVQIVRKESASTAVVFALAALAGLAFAALYARLRGVRTFVSVLAAAPVLFVLLFLARAPVTKLEGTAKALNIGQPRNDVPVVLVILDEFPVTSLMDASHHVDPVRYPHFAALARSSTWYRDAVGVHEHTTEAVPSILTGIYPKKGALPLAKDHPDNLFTLLGKRYRMHVFESVTQLCPSNLCVRRKVSFTSRMRSLADDLEVVYGHLVLPKRLATRLPSVSNTWQDFGGQLHGDKPAQGRNPLLVKDTKGIDAAVGRQMWQDQRFVWDSWVQGIDASRRPTLYAEHILLPHYPWRYLQNGKQYGNSLGIDGLNVDTWSSDPWLVEQGWQRHLLQVGFTDRLLGELRARLERQGIWDRAIVIVTADHGSSFVPGEHRRSITKGNIADIASVPLFVKYPHQRTGRIDDRDVETLDIVPTIADVLGLRLPYHVDGASLRRPASTRTEVTIRGRTGDHVSASAASVRRRKYQTLARQLRLFGQHDWRSVYEIGPNRRLIGRAVSSLQQRPGTGSVSIDGDSLFRAVDLRSDLSPSHVGGRVSGVKGALDLAIAINGRVAAVSRTFEQEGDWRFAAFVLESAFRQGANRVDVYAVSGTTLRRLRGGAGSESIYTLDRGSLRDGAGRTIRIQPLGALAGRVEDWFFERTSVRFGGWAGDAQHHALADSVVVFSGGKFVYSGTTVVGRRGMFKLRPDGSVIRAGFVFDLPRPLIGDGGRPLRFFVVKDGIASELPLPKGFPWRTS